MPNITSATSFFPRAVEGFVTTLASTISAGATTLTANSTAGYSVGDVIVWIIDPSTSAKQVLTGTVAAGNQITNVIWTYGTNQTHTAGATIVDYTTATGFDLHSAVILKHANQDGSLIQSVVATAIAQGAITAAQLSTSAIKLGYAQIASNSSAFFGTVAAVSGLSATITVPSGGRGVKITVHCPSITTNGATTPILTLWDGVVGSGTQLQLADAGATAALDVSLTVIAFVTPSAGSKTYNVGLATTNTQTAIINAASTHPAFILIEAI